MSVVLLSVITSLSPVCAQKQTQIITEESSEENIKNNPDNVFTHAAEKEEYKRKKTGFQVIGFLIIFAFIMRHVKKDIWKNVHKNVPHDD